MPSEACQCEIHISHNFQTRQELYVGAVSIDAQKTTVTFEVQYRDKSYSQMAWKVEGERFWENDLLHLDIDYSVEAAEDEHKNSGIYKVVP